MLKAQVFLALVLATSFATFSVNLEKKVIEDVQTYSYPNGQTTAYAQNTEKNGDWVYTNKAKIGENETHVMFDTTVGSNWQYVETANPALPTGTTVAVGQGRAQVDGKEVNVDTVKLVEEDFKDVKFVQSNKPAANANKNLFTAANFGFGLNRQKSQNFFKTLKDSKIKLEEGGNGFSFYFSEKVNQIFFGVPQKFFAQTGLEKIDAKSENDLNSWVIALGTKGVQLDKVNKLNNQPKYAVFDSTTKYIWAEDALVQQIVTSLQDQGIVCTDVNTQHNVGVYNCKPNGKAYPELSFTFSTYDTDGSDTKAYKVKHYIEKIAGADDRLLIRKQANYQTNGVTKVPQLFLKTQENKSIVLGTTFLQNVYTYFNQEDHTVNLAQSIELTPEAAGINNTWQLWSLILGGLVALGAIAALLALLSRVPYNPSVQPTLPPVVKQPQQFIQQQQPVYVTQSVVRPVQQPIYYVSSSPQRFIQSSLPPNYSQQFRQQQ